MAVQETQMIGAREFNRDVSAAKRAALDGPLIITDRGRPSHVLLSIEEYHRLSQVEDNWAELLAMPESDIDFDPPKLEFEERELAL